MEKGLAETCFAAAARVLLKLPVRFWTLKRIEANCAVMPRAPKLELQQSDIELDDAERNLLFDKLLHAYTRH